MKFSRICTFLMLIVISLPSFAMLPPNYLSVYRWKSCVSTYDHNGAEFVCLPDRKPLDCPRYSWKQLIRHSNLKFCPPLYRDDASSSSSTPIIDPSSSSSQPIGSTSQPIGGSIQE